MVLLLLQPRLAALPARSLLLVLLPYPAISRRGSKGRRGSRAQAKRVQQGGPVCQLALLLLLVVMPLRVTARSSRRALTAGVLLLLLLLL
jgi:hypothetical protein